MSDMHLDDVAKLLFRKRLLIGDFYADAEFNQWLNEIIADGGFTVGDTFTPEQVEAAYAGFRAGRSFEQYKITKNQVAPDYEVPTFIKKDPEWEYVHMDKLTDAEVRILLSQLVDLTKRRFIRVHDNGKVAYQLFDPA